MQNRLDNICQRYDELGEMIARPEVVADQPRWRELVMEHASLEEIVACYQQLKGMQQALEGAMELANEPDEAMRQLAQEEITDLKPRITEKEHELKVLLLPRDPDDARNALLEIRAGTGGEEAALFGADLLRMYSRYAERQRWKFEITSLSETDIGGVKEAVCLISGKDVFSHLKYESGVHRVQRVPQTESGGRIHTSAATVAVLPEGEDIHLDINPNDLRIDIFRSSGAGGQHINKTESAVRMIHIPTGIMVVCQDERSQIKNREKAMRVLMARLKSHYESEQHAGEAAARKSQIGSGDRSERIRTYNFPQGRVTDHRIGLTLYALSDFLSGNCDIIIQPLMLADQTRRLEEMGD
nr:peptide chain release factor 1 [bacterium]